MRVVEAAGGVGGVAARDREHRVRRLDQSELSIVASRGPITAHLCRPVWRGEGEPVVRASVQRSRL